MSTILGDLDGGRTVQYERWVAAMTRTERVALLTGLPALLRVIGQHVG